MLQSFIELFLVFAINLFQIISFIVDQAIIDYVRINCIVELHVEFLLILFGSMQSNFQRSLFLALKFVSIYVLWGNSSAHTQQLGPK